MLECEECGKRLGIFEGYRHPTLGKKHFVCNGCFNRVSESIEKWRNFISPYFEFFNNKSSLDNSMTVWKKIISSFNQKGELFDILWMEKENNNGR